MPFWLLSSVSARYNNGGMNAEPVKRMLEQRPFRPFEVHMSSGDIIQVRYPQFAFLIKNTLVIGDPDSEQVSICGLDQMSTIKTPQDA